MSNCTLDEFKAQIDKVLERVPDEPSLSGRYTPRASDQFTGQPSNSIIDQIRGIEFKKNRKAGS